MMDDLKKETVLRYISAIWGKEVNQLLDLKSGHFYIHVLNLLEQYNKKEENFETDKDRLTYVKSFLQEYYGEDVQIDQFLKFEIIFQTDVTCSASEVELELAKIAVILLGIGVLDKNGQYFVDSAMQLPSELHFDVMAIIQSVVQAGITEVCLTANIEKVLLEPSDPQTQTNAEKLLTWLQTSQNSILLATKAEQACLTASPIKLSDDRKSPPVCNLLKSHFMEPSQTSTPKEIHYCASNITLATMLQKDSPLRNISLLGHSLQEITSPLRGLSIDTTLPSSPLAQFVQSPQLIQKAIMKQKELEIRKLKQMMNDQSYLKYELQFSLQDKLAECVNKDAEISKLQDRIKELLYLRDSYDELQDLKSRNSEMEREMQQLNKKVLNFQEYKEQCQHLEKESSVQCEEVEKLHQEIEVLKMESSKYRDSLKAVSQLETQVTDLKLQLEVMHTLKTEWEGKHGAMTGNLEMAKETINKLRHELEELQAKQEENSPGESMGIYMDIQLGELKCQLEEFRQEKESLLQQLHELKKTVSSRDDELEQLKYSLTEKDLVVTEMSNLLKSHQEEKLMFKERVEQREENIEELNGIISSFENELGLLKESTNNKIKQINALEDLQCTQKKEIEVLICQLQEKDVQCLQGINEVSSMKMKFSELEEELQMRNQDVNALSVSKLNLEDLLKTKEEELISQHNDLVSKIEDICKLQVARDNAQEDVRCKEVENEHLCQMNAKLKEETEQVQMQLDAKCTLVEELTKELIIMNKEVLDLQTYKTSLEETKVNIETVNEDLRIKNITSDQQLQITQSELSSLYEELNSVKESMDEKSSLCNKLQDLMAQQSSERFKMESERNQVKNELIISEQQVIELTESVQQKNEKLQTLDSVKCKLEEQIDILNSQVKDKIDECTEYNHRMSSFTDKVSDLEKELQYQSQEMIALSDIKSNLEDELKKKEEELNSLHNDMSKLHIDRDSVQELLKGKETENENHCEMIAKLKEEAEIVKDQLVAKSSSADELTEALNIKCTEVLELQTQKTCLENENKNLEITCDEFKTKIRTYDQQLNGTESDLKQLRDQLTVGHEKISTLHKELNSVKESMEEKSSLCNNLQDLMAQQSDEIFKMESERNQVKNELIISEQQVIELTESVQQKNERLQTLDSVKCKLEEQIDILNSQIKDKVDECTKYNHRISSLTDKVSDLEKKLQYQSQEMIALSDIKSNLEDMLNKKEEELNSLHNDMSSKDEDMSKLQEILRGKEAENENLNEMIATLKQEIVQVKEKCDATFAVIAELTETLSIKNTKLLDLHSRELSFSDSEKYLTTTCEELRVENETYKQSVTNIESELQQVRDQLTARNVEMLTLNEELNRLKDSADETSKRFYELQNVVSQKSDELVLMASQNDEIKEELIGSLNEVRELKELTHSKIEELQTLDSVKCKLEEQIDILNSQIKDKIDECTEYNHRMSSLTDKVSDLEKKLQYQSQEMIALSDIKSNLEDVLNKKEEELNSLHNDMSSKDEDMSKLHIDRDSVQELLRGKETENENHCEMIAKLKEEAEIVKDQLVAKSSSADELTEALNIKCTEVLELQTQKTCLENENKNLEITCDELKTKIRTYDQQLNGTESDLKQLRDQLTVGHEKISTLHEELIISEQQVIELTESVQQKNEKLQTLDSVKCKLEEQIDILNSQIKDKIDECTEYNHRMSSLTDKVSDLEKELQYQSQEMIALSDIKSNLEDVLNKKEEELNSLHNDMSKLHIDRDSVQELLRGKETENENLCEMIAKLKQETLQVKEQFDAKCTVITELTDTMNIKNTEILDLQSQKIFIDDSKHDLETICNKLRTENEDYKQQLSSTESCLKEVREQLTKAQEELSILNEELRRLKKSMEEKSALCNEYQDIMSQSSSELVKMGSEMNRMKDELICSENEVKVLTESMHQKNEELKSLSADKCQLEEQIDNLKEQQITNSSTIDVTTEALDIKNADLLDKEQMMKDLKNTIDIQESRITDLIIKEEKNKCSIINLQEEIQKKEQHVSQLLKTNQEQSASIGDLTIILQSKESSISELNCELEKQISTNRLKINENAELVEQIQKHIQEIENLKARLKSALKELEEKCAMLEKVNSELLNKSDILSEARGELEKTSSVLSIVQEQLTCKETANQLLDAQLKEVNLSLHSTVEKLAVMEKVTAEKDIAEQDMNKKLSAITLTLQEKLDEIKTKNGIIDSLKDEHLNEILTMKEATENMLKNLQVKFESARESEIAALAKQKQNFDSEMAALRLDHEAHLSNVSQEHARVICKAESQHQEITSAEKVELEQQVTSLTKQYEITVQAIKTENETKLEQLRKNLQREQLAQKQMEQELISQRHITDRLDRTMEQKIKEHENVVQKVIEEHTRQISSLEENHSNKIALAMAEKNALLKENKEFTSRIAELHDNIKTINEDHQKILQDLISEESNLKMEQEQQLQVQNLMMDTERHAFQESLATKQEEIEKLTEDKENIQGNLTTIQLLIAQHERKIKILQEENTSFRERENKRLKESDSQMRTANEFCNNLRKQLDTANKKMESSEKELKSLSEQSKRCEQQVMKMKEANTSLTNALQIERDTNMKLQKRIGGGTSKYEDLKAKYENMQKSYASEVNRLKALVDSSDKAIKNYKLQLDEMGIALLGDASHFKQITEDKRRSQLQCTNSLASTKVPNVILKMVKIFDYDSLDDSLVSRDSGTLTRALRSSSRVSSDSISQKGSLNETTSSTDSVSLKREKLASGTEPKDKGARKQTEDRLSVCSTSSSQSIKSMNGVPAGCLPNAMSCANEPEGPDFEWDRLSELQRRNTLYLPHLKSAYPVEMQIVGKEKFSDDTLRLSLVPNKRGKASPASYIRNKREETRAKQSITETESNLNKRKAPIKHIYEEISGESPPKQLRTGPVYQRPGPPTPGKQPRRISGRFTPSHGKSPVHSGKVKLLGSPSAKHNPRQTHTPRRSPRLSSLITPASSLREEEERRESIAYNIGFTPMKSSGPNRMMRQKGFVSTDKSTIVADSTAHYRPGKAGLQTGQVSLSTTLHQSVPYEIFDNTCMTTEDELKLDLQKSIITEMLKTAHEPTSLKEIFIEEDSISPPEVESHENFEISNLSTKQQFTIAMNKSMNTDTEYKSHIFSKAVSINNFDTVSSFPQTETLILSTSHQWSDPSLNRDISLAQSQETDKDCSNDCLLNSEQSLTQNFTKDPLPVKKLVEEDEVNIKVKQPFTKRKLVFSEDNSPEKLQNINSENGQISTSNRASKKYKKTTVERALHFFHANSRDKDFSKSKIDLKPTKRKSELSIPRKDTQKVSKSLSTNTTCALSENHCIGDILTEKETLQDLLDVKTVPLNYSKVNHEKETHMHCDNIKVSQAKKKTKLSKLMRKALPFWKKNTSKHNVPSDESCTFAQCNNEFDLPSLDLESEATTLYILGSQNTIETLKEAILEEATTLDVLGTQSTIDTLKEAILEKARTLDVLGSQSTVDTLKEAILEKARTLDVLGSQSTIDTLKEVKLKKATLDVPGTQNTIHTLNEAILEEATTLDILGSQNTIDTLKEVKLKKATTLDVLGSQNTIDTLKEAILEKATTLDVLETQNTIGTLIETILEEAATLDVLGSQNTIDTLKEAKSKEATTLDILGTQNTIGTLKETILEKATTLDVLETQNTIGTLKETILEKATTLDVLETQNTIGTLKETILEEATTLDVLESQNTIDTLKEAKLKKATTLDILGSQNTIDTQKEAKLKEATSLGVLGSQNTSLKEAKLEITATPKGKKYGFNVAKLRTKFEQPGSKETQCNTKAVILKQGAADENITIECTNLKVQKSSVRQISPNFQPVVLSTNVLKNSNNEVIHAIKSHNNTKKPGTFSPYSETLFERTISLTNTPARRFLQENKISPLMISNIQIAFRSQEITPSVCGMKTVHPDNNALFTPRNKKSKFLWFRGNKVTPLRDKKTKSQK